MAKTPMVQLWLTHTGEVCLCERIVTQIQMAVLSLEQIPEQIFA